MTLKYQHMILKNNDKEVQANNTEDSDHKCFNLESKSHYSNKCNINEKQPLL